MRILADAHIAPRSVDRLRALGHDAVRVSDRLPANAVDDAIVALAVAERRVIVTQDLDFSALVALSGSTVPSVISLRLGSATVEHVDDALQRVLPGLEAEVLRGVIVAVEDQRVRIRRLPVG